MVEEKKKRSEITLRKWIIFYPESEEEVVSTFKEWCKINAGNKHILGIRILMKNMEWQDQLALLTKEIVDTKIDVAKLKGEDVESNSGIPTLGGKIG